MIDCWRPDNNGNRINLWLCLRRLLRRLGLDAVNINPAHPGGWSAYKHAHKINTPTTIKSNANCIEATADASAAGSSTTGTGDEKENPEDGAAADGASSAGAESGASEGISNLIFNLMFLASAILIGPLEIEME